MMRYQVIFESDGQVRVETDSYEDARVIAIAYSNWNHACNIVDTEAGKVIKHFPAYKDRKIDLMST